MGTPVSIRVQHEDFDAGVEARALTDGRIDVGAVVTFIGTVRGEANGRTLMSMTLEHYPGMTEGELRRIADEAAGRWPLQGVRVIHRVGELRPGANIVLVAVASKHRHAAFEAAEFLMDYLKTRAPFWKKETGTDGVGHWVDARESDDEALARWARPQA